MPINRTGKITSTDSRVDFSSMSWVYASLLCALLLATVVQARAAALAEHESTHIVAWRSKRAVGSTEVLAAAADKDDSKDDGEKKDLAKRWKETFEKLRQQGLSEEVAKFKTAAELLTNKKNTKGDEEKKAREDFIKAWKETLEKFSQQGLSKEIAKWKATAELAGHIKRDPKRKLTKEEVEKLINDGKKTELTKEKLEKLINKSIKRKEKECECSSEESYEDSSEEDLYEYLELC